MAGNYRVGISGWRYPPWRGTFFPRDLPQKDELAYAARKVNSVEINGTFYSLQRPSSFRTWFNQTPDDFLFSVKGPRYITHIRRLKDVAAPLANFFASGVLRLEHKLGPLLWQLPPSLPYDAQRLEAFFRMLPRTTEAAARMARQHQPFLTNAWTKSATESSLRHALEVRHPSFEKPEFIALLREYDVAVVVADTAGKWPLIEDVTSDFIYLRLHGDETLYVSGYTPTALRKWKSKAQQWRRGANPSAARRLTKPAPTRPAGRDVFVYFDNDVKVRAPFDAMTLAHLLGIGPAPGEPPPVESIAEKARAPSEWPWRYPRGRRKISRKRTASVRSGKRRQLHG
jgi:uncharacterized protein YecE (DUF72 family)